MARLERSSISELWSLFAEYVRRHPRAWPHENTNCSGVNIHRLFWGGGGRPQFYVNQISENNLPIFNLNVAPFLTEIKKWVYISNEQAFPVLKRAPWHTHRRSWPPRHDQKQQTLQLLDDILKHSSSGIMLIRKQHRQKWAIVALSATLRGQLGMFLERNCWIKLTNEHKRSGILTKSELDINVAFRGIWTTVGASEDTSSQAAFNHADSGLLSQSCSARFGICLGGCCSCGRALHSAPWSELRRDIHGSWLRDEAC